MAEWDLTVFVDLCVFFCDCFQVRDAECWRQQIEPDLMEASLKSLGLFHFSEEEVQLPLFVCFQLSTL